MVEVVFVHHGNQLPQHLVANLQIIRTHFPKLKIHLLVDQDVKFNQKKLHGVQIHEVQLAEHLALLLEQLSPDPKFREGFWRYSLARLFTLISFHEQHPSLKILHIESDVFLFPNFPFDKFEKLSKPSWLKVSSNRDVAALVYLPSVESTRTMGFMMQSELEKGVWIDDMTILAKIMEKACGSFGYLPIISPKNPDLGSRFLSKTLAREMYRDYEIFGGVFDGAHLGVWLTGWDPRNSYGFTKYLDSSIIEGAKGLVNPAGVKFEFDSTNFLSYTANGVSTHVFCLHVHSKSLKIFNQDWQTEISRLVLISQNRRGHFAFNFPILLSLLNSNYKNRTIVPFLLQSTRATRFCLSMYRKIRVKFRA